MAKSRERGGVSGRLKKGGQKMRGGALKHRKKSGPLSTLGRGKRGSLHAAPNTEQPTDLPLLGDDDDFGDVPVSPSTDEDEGPLATLPDEDAFAAEAPASQDPGQKQKAKQPKKRKAEAAAIAGDSGIQVAKRKKKSNAAWQEQQELSTKITQLSARQQAQWLRDSWSSATGASELETEAISERCVVAISEGEVLEERLQSIAADSRGELQGQGLPNGSPAALVICAAAMGCVHLMKKLPSLNKACRIAKLFAKHMKVQEQQAHLDSHVVGIGCGTPNRLLKLADMDALKLDRLRLLVLDLQLDAKQRTTLSMLETAEDFWVFVSKHVAPLLHSQKMKIVLVDQSKVK